MRDVTHIRILKNYFKEHFFFMLLLKFIYFRWSSWTTWYFINALNNFVVLPQVPIHTVIQPLQTRTSFRFLQSTGFPIWVLCYGVGKCENLFTCNNFYFNVRLNHVSKNIEQDAEHSVFEKKYDARPTKA